MYIKHDKDLVTGIWGMIMKKLPGVWKTEHKILCIPLVESVGMSLFPTPPQGK